MRMTLHYHQEQGWIMNAAASGHQIRAPRLQKLGGVCDATDSLASGCEKGWLWLELGGKPLHSVDNWPALL
jgi:hypothetical protein